jgi:MFS transporter, FHS family, glucose/mannose:H+ symporter
MGSDAAPNHSRRLQISAQFGFFVIGIITVLLGQALPVLSQRLSLNDAQAGTLFLAQFSGSIIGTLASGPLIRRLGFTVPLLIGLVLLMVGLPALNGASLNICRLAVFVYGTGLGISIPATNLLVIEMTPFATRTPALNFMNFCWGLGAIASRPFVVLFSGNGSLVSATLLLDAMLLVVAVFVFSARFGVEHTLTGTEPQRTSPTHIWKQPLAWLIAFFNFMNIGIESGLGGWLTTFSERLQAEGKLWTNSAVVFFGFLVVGRGVAVIISRRLSENSLLLVCTVTLLSGIVLVLMTGNPLTPIFGAAIAGLGTSAVFPTNMVRFAKIFGPEATRKATPLFISGTAGAATLSSLVGFVSARSGSLETGIVVLLIAAVALVLLQVWFTFARTARTQGVVPSDIESSI